MYVLVLHGIGGINGLEEATGALNRQLIQLGHSGIQPTELLIPNYQSLLEHPVAWGDPPRVESTWQPKDKEALADALSDYIRQEQRLRRRLAPLATDPSPLANLPERFGDAATKSPWFERAHRYASQPRCRSAIYNQVRGWLPQRVTEIVIIGYSLGSVVAADLITRLPKDTKVRMLLTIGSPLGWVSELRTGSKTLMQRGFPADRLLSWVNLYDPDDAITGFRGIRRFYQAALDVPIKADRHDPVGYLSHEAAAAAMGHALHGSGHVVPMGRLPARGLPPEWQPLLAKFAYTQALARSIPADEHERRRRVNMAREELAYRTLDIAAELDRGTQTEPGAEGDLVAYLPSVDDLVKHPGEILSEMLSDLELLPTVVELAASWPLAPFEMETKPRDERRKMALERFLNVVRQRDARARGRSDQEFAEAVQREIKEALDDFGLSLAALAPAIVLGGLGLAVLAATGIGFAAAAPAGLAGAAAITATLAAFGPGGMAGGIGLLALLSGVGSAMFAAAATQAAIGTTSERTRAKLDRQEIKRLAAAEPPQLAYMLALVVAVLRAEQKLEIDPGGRSERHGQALRTVAALLAEARAELALSVQLGVVSRQLKAWKNRVEHLERAEALLMELADRKESGKEDWGTAGERDRQLDRRSPR